MVPACGVRRFRPHLRFVRRGRKNELPWVGWHEPTHRVSRIAGYLRRDDDGSHVYDNRGYFFARRTRTVPGVLFWSLGHGFRLRADSWRLAYRSDFLACHLLREPARRDRRHHCLISVLSILASQRGATAH